MKTLILILTIGIISHCIPINSISQEESISKLYFGPDIHLNKEVELKINPNFDTIINLLGNEISQLDNCKLFIILKVYENKKVYFKNHKTSCIIESSDSELINKFFKEKVEFVINTENYTVLNDSTEIAFPINF
jgi:hypothetical protein